MDKTSGLIVGGIGCYFLVAIGWIIFLIVAGFWLVSAIVNYLNTH